MATCLKEGRHTLAVSEVTSKCLSYSLPPRPPPFTGKAPLWPPAVPGSSGEVRGRPEGSVSLVLLLVSGRHPPLHLLWWEMATCMSTKIQRKKWRLKMPPVLRLPTFALQVYCTLSSDIHNPTISTTAILYKYVTLGQIKKICCRTTC